MPQPAFKFSFDAVYYHVKDMDRAIEFYQRILGFPLQSRDYVARFRVDGVLFELVPAHASDAVAGPGNARLSLSVANIDEAVRYLASRNVKSSEPKQEIGGKISLFHDPDGNELCLWQST
ncbi:MAG TPA: VOC family protein [Candidatus Bathyarchaeia archaeon]|nr:VOC family protein [Candidatus Bathyarchaeia archaeon]